MKCRVCDNNDLEMFLDLGDQPHCDSLLLPKDLDHKEPYYPLKACFCHNCTTVQIDHTVPKETMFEEYLYISGTTKTLRNHFEKSTQRLIEKFNLKEGNLIVDIGSNDGTWLSYFKERKLRILGIDGAKNLAELANSRGIETWPKFFNKDVAKDIVSEKGRADLITAAGVFFHLEELHSVCEGVKKLLSKNGIFCVQAIYLGNILENNQFDQFYHEHLTYWTVRSLNELLSIHGLEIFDVLPLTIHGGSIEYCIGWKGKNNITNSVKSYLINEKYKKYDKIEAYKKFASRVWQIRDELLNIINSKKDVERSIQAYSAPAKGATLLNSFGLTTKQIDCAVEVNPLKIGKYIPGCRIPIVDEKITSKPDVYLLLAWNFKEELLQKNTDFIKNSGEFIIPIPKPQIICQKH